MSTRQLAMAFALFGAVIAACGSGTPASTTPSPASTANRSPSPSAESSGPVVCAGRASSTRTPPPASPSFVPRGSGVPATLPTGGAGYDAFATVVPGVMSRSGTPTAPQFSFLRANGWRSVVDVRTTDDRTYAGFAELGFKYLYLPVDADRAPTDDQARSFLCFVTDPANLPAHVHDNSGIERVGVFVALYRYSVQGWPMSAALQEAIAFGDALSQAQTAFLNGWATAHRAGELYA